LIERQPSDQTNHPSLTADEAAQWIYTDYISTLYRIP